MTLAEYYDQEVQTLENTAPQDILDRQQLDAHTIDMLKEALRRIVEANFLADTDEQWDALDAAQKLVSESFYDETVD